MSLIVVIVSLTTCTKSEACPTTWSPEIMLANGDDYLPYRGPDAGLFPQAIPSAMNQSGLMVPLPTAGGFLDFVQTMILGFVAFLLRRSPPPKK